MNRESAEFSAHFNRTFAAIATSEVYHDAVRSSMPDLPDWVVPFSVTNLADLTLIARDLHLDQGDCFVDLACGLGGPGIWVAEQSNAKLVGVDFSRAAIEAALELALARGLEDRARFVVADASDTDLPTAVFAGVMSVDSVQFLDPHSVFREIARLLRPGGVSVIRTWEAIVEDLPLPTMVHDYRPVLGSLGLVVQKYEEVGGIREREHAFHSALQVRGDALSAEIGPIAANILDEARDSLAREDVNPRVRKVWIVAEKSGERVAVENSPKK
jgi:SAM-dependent methyltransferase